MICKSDKITYVLLFSLLAFFLLRMAIFISVYQCDPDRIMRPDSSSYEKPALSLLANGLYNSSPDPASIPEYKRTPGYPLFIATMYSLFGESRFAVITIQIILSIFIILFGYLIASKLFSQKVGIVSVFFLGFDPVMTLHSQLMLTETLSALFNILSCLFLVYLIRHFTQRDSTVSAGVFYALGLGFALAMATMVRPVSYYLIFPIILVIIGMHQVIGLKLRQSATLSILILIPFLLIVGGWQVRNYIVIGTHQFSGISGLSMLNYRAAGVLAMREGISLEEARERLGAQLISENTDGNNEYERSFAYGLSLVRSEPILYLKLMGAGSFNMLFGPGAGTFLDYLGHKAPLYKTTDFFISPLNYLGMLAQNSLGVLILFWCTTFLFLNYLCMAVGISSLTKIERNDCVIHFLLIGICVYYILISSGVESYSRFRCIFGFIFSFYAGYGAVCFFGRAYNQFLLKWE